MVNNFNLFSGKEKEHNERILTLLYNKGALSSWDIAKLYPKTKTNKKIHALNSTLNKRLRDLEKKHYLKKAKNSSKYVFRFKGIIAALIIQKQPKLWNDLWIQYFEPTAKEQEEKIQTQIKTFDVKIQEEIMSIVRAINLNPNSFSTMVNYSERVKDLITKGIINFDIIDANDLFLLTTVYFMLPKIAVE